jgi:hypothetical protein
MRSLLAEFGDAHRGVRVGQLFGVPAAYAGRRLFASLADDGIVVRLPRELARREIAGGATPHTRGGAKADRTSAWVMYRPRTLVEARRLWPILEAAARCAAETIASES